jgi:hypothetical protein
VLRRKKKEREFVPFKPYAKIIEELDAKRDPNEKRFTVKYNEIMNLNNVYNPGDTAVPLMTLK